jgi:hypothetical protein
MVPRTRAGRNRYAPRRRDTATGLRGCSMCTGSHLRVRCAPTNSLRAIPRHAGTRRAAIGTVSTMRFLRKGR